MYAIDENVRRVNGSEMRTFSRRVDRRNVIEAEAGTDGKKTYIALRDWWRTNIRVHPLGKGGREGLEIVMNGADELSSVTEALEFVVRVLKEEGENGGV